MAHDIDALPKGAGAWGQAVAAVVLIAALGAGVLLFPDSSSPVSGPQPVTCSGSESETAPAETGKAPQRVSGAQLCEALHRPDLAELLGTPGDTPKSASGGSSTFKPVGGKEVITPSARVELGTYTVTLSAASDGLAVAGSAAYLGPGAQERTVLGRPAVFYAERTLSISFRLDGGDARGGPGVPARALSVARDPKDSGGSFDLAIWREDGGWPDDAALLRVAEKVLPTIPGWSTAG
ncbi:DUF6215 domain-containing protein [Streptomyces sp. NPDC003035]|uniref:DUF6215 domain-containing protein n=1 Tax=Streptomyces sp. NPDC003035 TaxID=3364676 RepID=UPI003677BEE6